MAGWDEGNVFYSDQRYLAEEEEEETYTRNQAKRKFVEFIRSYQDHGEGSDAVDVYIYRDQLSRQKNKLHVDLEDVKAFDEDLCELLKRSPVIYLPLFEAAASEVYASFQNKNAEDRSKYVDMQTLKLQENPEDVPTGEMPRSMMLSIDRHMVQRIVPGTRVTLLEAIVRISESLARMSLKSVANEAHRQEMINVEAQIKRRLPVGSYMSTKNILREMGRLGLSEPSVRRCLIFLSQQGDVDFRRERRVVYRSH
eukprot:jgi/Pico_ML_1/52457/g3159.t1